MKKIILILTLIILLPLQAQKSQEIVKIGYFQHSLLNMADTTATGDTLSGADSVFITTDKFHYDGADSVAFILEIVYADSLDNTYDTLAVGFDIKETYMSINDLYLEDYDTFSEMISRFSISSADTGSNVVTARAFNSGAYAVSAGHTHGKLKGWVWNGWKEGTRKVKYNIYMIKYWRRK